MESHAAEVRIARSLIANTVPYAYAAIRTQRTDRDRGGLRHLRICFSRSRMRSARLDREVLRPSVRVLRSRLRFLQRMGLGWPGSRRPDPLQGSHPYWSAREQLGNRNI